MPPYMRILAVCLDGKQSGGPVVPRKRGDGVDLTVRAGLGNRRQVYALF